MVKEKTLHALDENLVRGEFCMALRKYGTKKARDGIRTRDPRLGKAILHH